ncbi:MAG: antitoxin VbhA family protein [Rickettsiales bacterium]|nr:antitoxin VbhA family protein [Rickettsiales bacterium]
MREKAINWGIAIGLQAVDNLTVSDYLIELAKLNIEGKISDKEVEKRIREHYKKQ